MKKFFCIFLILPILLGACSKNKIFEKYIKMENYSWKRDNIVRFEVPIEDTKASYKIIIAIRHTSFYPYANLRLNMSITDPDGNSRTKDHNIFLREKDGSFKGQGAGDIWDYLYTALEDVNFTEKGTYVFEIQNTMPMVVTTNIMDIGLIVKKTK